MTKMAFSAGGDGGRRSREPLIDPRLLLRFVGQAIGPLPSGIGCNEQIFGVIEQIPARGLSDQVGATPYDVVYPHNAERAGPGHAYPRGRGLHLGSDEQISGAIEQIPEAHQSDQ
jgi:hypothetical protein